MVLEVIIYIAYGVLGLIALIMLRQLQYANRHFVPPMSKAFPADQELPSVSVCIPARNEQHALTECLESVLKSTYPKLEIIVLDDVSGDDTSALIKSFASEGVRFVQGRPLTRDWLGKNHALQGLLEESSGSYVLFMGVDTRISPDAIKNIVQYSLAEKASMVSVMPRREDGWRASVVFSPLRFFWEIVFHRRLWPATASSAWIIRRDILQKRFDGFRSFRQAIEPETKIAAELASTGEYRFLMSTMAFGVAYEKKWRSQLLTSIRLLYPILGGQPAMVMIACLDLFLLLMPTVILSTLFVAPFYTLHAVSLAFYALYTVVYALYTKRMWNKGWLLGALLWPYLLAQEIVLVLTSMIQYWRGTVTWKGRLVRSELATTQPEVQN